MAWLSFDALKAVHRVTQVTEGVRYSVTLYTPGKLEHLTSEDWDHLGKLDFPIDLCNSEESFQIRRLTPQDPPTDAAQSSEAKEKVYDQQNTSAIAQVNLTASSEKSFQNIPFPSIADEEEPHILYPKTLLECCRCARCFNQGWTLRKERQCKSRSLKSV